MRFAPNEKSSVLRRYRADCSAYLDQVNYFQNEPEIEHRQCQFDDIKQHYECNNFRKTLIIIIA